VAEREAVSGGWWGEFEIPLDETRYWRIGPLHLWIRRTAKDWRIVRESEGDGSGADCLVAQPPPREPSGDSVPLRLGFRRTADELAIAPRLPDRPVVVNPESPFSIPAGEEITFYAGCPLWFTLTSGSPSRLLLEEPIFRPSDTWFGEMTTAGELCYASRTSARLNLDNLPQLPHRVVAAVRIRNRSDESLALEKLKLPMPHLSIFGSEDGGLWTEAVTLDREEAGEIASLRLEKGPPEGAGPARRIVGPRLRPERRTLFRAFRRLNPI
jgi:hypothetical protein